VWAAQDIYDRNQRVIDGLVIHRVIINTGFSFNIFKKKNHEKREIVTRLGLLTVALSNPDIVLMKTFR